MDLFQSAWRFSVVIVSLCFSQIAQLEGKEPDRKNHSADASVTGKQLNHRRVDAPRDCMSFGLFTTGKNKVSMHLFKCLLHDMLWIHKCFYGSLFLNVFKCLNIHIYRS